jgi:predicted component of type VI protein secretion system
MIVRLRLWGTEYLHPLPEPLASPGPLTLGSAASCEVRLHDREGRLSREHAVLRAEATGWEIRDLDSKNGLFVAGARTDRAMLQPGVKVQLGGLTLIAESLKFIRLRSLVARLLGWAPSRQAAVDGGAAEPAQLRHRALAPAPDRER